MVITIRRKDTIIDSRIRGEENSDYNKDYEYNKDLVTMNMEDDDWCSFFSFFLFRKYEIYKKNENTTRDQKSQQPMHPKEGPTK